MTHLNPADAHSASARSATCLGLSGPLGPRCGRSPSPGMSEPRSRRPAPGASAGLAPGDGRWARAGGGPRGDRGALPSGRRLHLRLGELVRPRRGPALDVPVLRTGHRPPPGGVPRRPRPADRDRPSGRPPGVGRPICARACAIPRPNACDFGSSGSTGRCAGWSTSANPCIARAASSPGAGAARATSPRPCDTEEALRRREQEFATLADNSPDIVARFDRSLRHLYVNAAVERVTGRPRADFLGRTNEELGMPPGAVRALVGDAPRGVQERRAAWARVQLPDRRG